MAPVDWDDLIQEFVEAWKLKGSSDATIETHRNRLLAVSRVLGGDPLELSVEDGRFYIEVRSQAKTGPEDKQRTISINTVRGEIDTIRIMQRWAVKMGWVSKATWEDLTSPKKAPTKKRDLRERECGALLRAAEKLADDPPPGAPKASWQWWPSALMLLLHGLRPGEVLRVRKRDVEEWRDVEGQQFLLIHVYRSKTEEGVRHVPIVWPEAVDAIKQVMADRGEEQPLCLSLRGGDKGEYTSSQMLRRRLKQTCEAAGVDSTNVVPYSGRHTGATIGLTSGLVDPFAMSRMYGHVDQNFTQRTYTRVRASQARPAAAAIGHVLELAKNGRPQVRVVEE